MHVLVTGGSGFIPSHIVDRLLQDGHKVRVLDLWQSEDSAIHNANTNFEFIKGDVLDDVLIKSCMKGIDRVIHMAAVLGTAETITTYDVEKVCMVNIIGTTKILKAAKIPMASTGPSPSGSNIMGCRWSGHRNASMQSELYSRSAVGGNSKTFAGPSPRDNPPYRQAGSMG